MYIYIYIYKIEIRNSETYLPEMSFFHNGRHGTFRPVNCCKCLSGTVSFMW